MKLGALFGTCGAAAVGALGSVQSAGIVALGAAVIPAVIETSPAQAQMVSMGRGLASPEISTRSLERYGQILKLDKEQSEAAKQLLEAYQDTSRKYQEEMEEQMKALREEAEDGDFSTMMEKMPEIMKKAGEKREAAQKSFLDDFKSLLTKEQEAAWPKVERLRRREGGLGFSTVSGAAVDLTSLTDRLKLSDADKAKIADTVEQYEQDMDRLLQERAKADEERSKDEKGGFDFNPEKWREQMDKMREAGIKVRDLNKQYERKIAAILPEESKAKFQDDFRKRSFRQIYRTSQVSKELAAAEKFDDLTPDQKRAIAELKETYGRDLASLNEKWSAAQDQAETEGKAGGMFTFPGMANNESPELAAARKARRDYDKSFGEKLKTTLNDGQRERLPKRNDGMETRIARGGGFVQTLEMDEEEGEDGAVHSSMEVRVVAPR